ncbi:DUF2809 domain-containing protein [Pseudomonas aeruginosa]|uniref:DUF2809 domain-containing protein n=1 Tax=Pseudomonas aeruginosa TaxID=287 RepID=UPI000A6ECCA9|nr:DUF2809 domain-containing protein [Pseudomonas aeruginosa]
MGLDTQLRRRPAGGGLALLPDGQRAQGAGPWLASAAFAVGALLELGRYLAAQLHWQFSSPVLRIVLGSTADGFDLLAYALGALLAWWLERRR